MKKKDNVYYNYEGYYDPTAGEALDKIMQKESGKQTAKVKQRRKRREMSTAKVVVPEAN